jgi:NADPH2:quinone reductase
MKAIRVHKYGGAENLSLDEVEKPQPAEGEVLIKTEIAGMNFADTMLRSGTYLIHPPVPFIPGFEVAGAVEAAGSKVTNVQIGQKVLAILPLGGYAEYAVAAANRVIPIPEGMDAGKATVLLIQGLTAVGLLNDLKSGQTILIHAAAGGVGSLLVQIAKIKGARVIGTASSTEKLEKVTSLGADAGINYTEADWSEQVLKASGGRGADLIIEMAGGEIGRQNFKCLAAGGTIIVYGAASGEDFQISALTLLTKMQTVRGYNLNLETPQNMARFSQELMSYVSEGKLEVTVQEFPLENAMDAQRAIEGRKTMGKVVLTV